MHKLDHFIIYLEISKLCQLAIVDLTIALIAVGNDQFDCLWALLIDSWWAVKVLGKRNSKDDVVNRKIEKWMANIEAEE